MHLPRTTLPLIGATLFLLVSASAAADLSSAYEWKPMKIGGGGFIVGMDVSRTTKDLVYCRADVSGAYRWIPETKSWKQLVTSTSLPAEWVAYGKYAGVESIVGAPNAPDVAYMAFNGKPWGDGVGQIFKSTNRGDTWTPTRFQECGVVMEPNGEGRQDGERLAVDPANADVVYFASIKNGLWVTEDGGNAWRKIEAVSTGQAPHGVSTVVFGATGGQTKSKTSVIYVTVEKGGIFRSGDAGATWETISSGGPGDAGEPRDATVGPDGAYYVAYNSDKQATGAVWKYAGGTWSNITPTGQQGGNKPYGAISVDPFDSKHVVAMICGGKTFVSEDGGKTWTFHLFNLNSPDVLWLGTQNNGYLSTGEFAFDPFEKGKVWYAEGFGVWTATDLTTPEIAWHEASRGIEEACGNDVVAPPGGKPVGAMWDIGTFYFDDVDAYTAQRAWPNFMSAWAIDWCVKDPKFLVAVFQNHLNLPPHANSAGYSADGGRTWTRFPAIDQETAPKDLAYGVIAVASNSPDKIVWSPTSKKLPWHTADRGQTWKPCAIEGVTETGLTSFPMNQKPLCADRAEPDTFYFYTPQAGTVFCSTDGGATFARVGTATTNFWNGILKATPGIAKDLWLASGDNRGLWHSTDGGKTWSQAAALGFAATVGFGKAKDEGGYPTLFVAGSVAGQTGIYRSTDQGKTWDKLVDYPLGIFDFIDAIDGDKDKFGRVYVAFSSSGFAYGKDDSSPAK